MSYEIPLISTCSSFGNKKRFDAHVGGVFFSGNTEQEAREKAEKYVCDHGWVTNAECDKQANLRAAAYRAEAAKRLCGSCNEGIGFIDGSTEIHQDGDHCQAADILPPADRTALDAHDAQLLSDRDFRWLKALCVDGDCSIVLQAGKSIEEAVKAWLAEHDRQVRLEEHEMNCRECRLHKDIGDDFPECVRGHQLRATLRGGDKRDGR